MELENRKGDRFKLSIIGYEFPEIENEKYDSNWLLIKIEARITEGEWEVTDPCLLTNEVEILIEWLKSVKINNNSKDTICFTEPNIEFSLFREAKKGEYLQVNLAYECSPPWFDKSSFKSLKMNFLVKDLNLDKEINSLCQQLKLFPQRMQCDENC